MDRALVDPPADYTVDTRILRAAMEYLDDHASSPVPYTLGYICKCNGLDGRLGEVLDEIARLRGEYD